MTGLVRRVAVFAVLLAALAAGQVRADDNDGVWTTEFIKGIGNVASVNGALVHGDRYRIIIRGEKCDQAERFVSFYTAKKNADIPSIDGRFLYVSYNGHPMLAKALFPQKALSGYIVIIHFGIIPVADALQQNADAAMAKVVLQDTPDFKASDYFDIEENSWSTRNLGNAVAELQKKCLQARKH